ncbi:MAG: (E)-4-hydroxy-3-methylbut-2-enyl-diphosphate synthase [Paludibacteraceae bacterium]|nr:(E)-4-hydroxy-3-methylbut-2-enyl-diphosphate synthase [Paludibacteraceae bacterium]
MNISFKKQRRKTNNAKIGPIYVGSDYPIRIQTMANTSTDDIDGSVAQAVRCAQSGADLFRYTTQGLREVESVKEINRRLKAQGIRMPLVADIHFRSDVADAAAAVVEKVRINPGNYANDPSTIHQRFSHLLSLCKQHGTALRIGVNHGSLSKRIMEQYGDTPEGMTQSCMEYLRIAVAEGFENIVLSIKASNTRIMVETVRLLVKTMDKEDMHFPLHLGVTEAGEGEDGRIKSAVGIGALLADGIGDTVRVSLSEEPEAELPVARDLVDYFMNPASPRYNGNTACVENGCVTYTGTESDAGQFALHAAAECGHLLWDNDCNELQIRSSAGLQLPDLENDILQATGIKRYKTEFVSCPGCGRTMFDLQSTVAAVKEALRNHPDKGDLQGLKIAIMGCIVNGPGEMADADYGYVGAGRDRISLYRGKECVLKNIPQAEAVNQLIHLIQQDKK